MRSAHRWKPYHAANVTKTVGRMVARENASASLWRTSASQDFCPIKADNVRPDLLATPREARNIGHSHNNTREPKGRENETTLSSSCLKFMDHTRLLYCGLFHCGQLSFVICFQTREQFQGTLVIDFPPRLLIHLKVAQFLVKYSIDGVGAIGNSLPNITCPGFTSSKSAFSVIGLAENAVSK
jgi:hypothetical protein